MSDAPEILWAWPNSDNRGWYAGGCSTEPTMAMDDVRYVRADLFDALKAENERLRDALVAERTENLWNAYGTGFVRDGRWSHSFMSDGEWLAMQCGLDPSRGWYDVAEVTEAIPRAARAVLTATDATTKTDGNDAPPRS